MARTQHSALALFVTALISVTVTTTARAQTQVRQPATQATVATGPSAPGTPTPSAEQPEVATEPAGVLELTFHQADEQFQAANYEQAAVLFNRVWELSRTAENHEQWGRYTAIFAFNAATSYRLAGHCNAAHEAFSNYVDAFDQLESSQQRLLREATDLPADNRAWLNDLTKECPTLPATNSLSTAPHGENSPSTAKGADSVRATGNWLLDVNVPTKNAPTPLTHTPTQDASAAEPTTSRVGWILTSTGVASLAVSGYFLWSGLQNNSAATKPENKHEPFKDYTASRNRDYVTSAILGGLGLGLAGVGVYVLGTNEKTDAAQGITERKLWLFANGTQLGVAGEL